MNIDKYILSKGCQELGVLWSDIEQHILTPAQYTQFTEWMRGQTCGIQGDLNSEYVTVCYTGDLERFLRGQKCVD